MPVGVHRALLVPSALPRHSVLANVLSLNDEAAEVVTHWIASPF
jgi:hypothetical protein